MEHKGYFKIGFAAGTGGNPTGIGDYVKALDQAGIPATISCVDGTVGISDALQLMNNGSAVPHNLLYRVVRDRNETYAVPKDEHGRNYAGDPKKAARLYFERIIAFVRAETMVEENKDKVWISIGNELNKDSDRDVDWIGRWATETAKIANAAGYKVMAFGWAAGTPEPHHWRLPGMQEYLRYCAAHRNMAGIALHEYDYDMNGRIDGAHIGRFTTLFDVCDDLGIARPYLFIKENGWKHDTIPGDQQKALNHLGEWAKLYGKYPEILGTTLWYLGAFNGTTIYNKVQKLIEPVTQLALAYGRPTVLSTAPRPQAAAISNGHHTAPAATAAPTAAPDTLETYLRGVVPKHMFNPKAALLRAMRRLGDRPIMSERWVTYDGKRYAVQAGRDPDKNVSIYYARVNHWDDITRIPLKPPMVTPAADTSHHFFKYWPCTSRWITQGFGERPGVYQQYGLPGHEGIDFGAAKDSPFYAVADGTVVWASNRRMSGSGESNYGYYVVIDHGNGYHSLYAHAHPNLPVQKGELVSAGDVVGYSGNTGNGTGYHLHFSLLHQNDPQNGYPRTRFGWYIDPTPYIPQDLPIPALRAAAMGEPTAAPGVLSSQPRRSGAALDLTRFMIGENDIQFMVQHGVGGPSERIRTEYMGNGIWRYVKNTLWELWQVQNGEIRLIADISPYKASDDTERYYVLQTQNTLGAVWAKQMMHVGQTHVDQGHSVQFYAKQTGHPHHENSGQATNTTVVMDLMKNYTFDTYGQGITFDEVLKVKGNTEIHYFGIKDGRSYGRVAWNAPFGRSEITEIVTGQHHYQPAHVPFLDHVLGAVANGQTAVPA